MLNKKAKHKLNLYELRCFKFLKKIEYNIETSSEEEKRGVIIYCQSK